MNWLLQKRKVERLDNELSDKRAELSSIRQRFRQNLGDTLGRTDILIWTFSAGMLWETNHNPDESRPAGARRTLSTLTRYTMFAMRVLGLRF